MGLTYDTAPERLAALRQGEIMGPVWEHRTRYPPRLLPRRQAASVQSFLYPLAVMLSPDCDLERDYEMRFETVLTSLATTLTPADEHPNSMSHVLLCSLLTRDYLRPRFVGDKETWRRVSSNQDERYHHLEGAPVGPASYLHECFLDFKKVISIPIDRLYDGVFAGDVERVAVLPAYYVHDLVHRFYTFLSRVAIP